MNKVFNSFEIDLDKVYFLVITFRLFGCSVSSVKDKVRIAPNLYQNRDYYTHFL